MPKRFRETLDLSNDLWRHCMQWTGVLSLSLTCRRFQQVFGGCVKILDSALVQRDFELLARSMWQVVPLSCFSKMQIECPPTFTPFFQSCGVELMVAGGWARAVLLSAFQEQNLPYAKELKAITQDVDLFVFASPSKTHEVWLRVRGRSADRIPELALPEFDAQKVIAPNLLSDDLSVHVICGEHPYDQNQNLLRRFDLTCCQVGFLYHPRISSKPSIFLTPACWYSLMTRKTLITGDNGHVSFLERLCKYRVRGHLFPQMTPVFWTAIEEYLNEYTQRAGPDAYFRPGSQVWDAFVQCLKDGPTIYVRNINLPFRLALQ